ncbi:MAG: hypothetical protein JKX81_09760 [Arenicella sp.]|nr:hypothetical protein [Arenicella sp.]
MKLETVKRPTAIILASQLIEGNLQTIFGKRETASLMIAGATVIEHVLDELQDLNFAQCFVLAGDNAHEIHAVVMGLQHWGMKIEVMNYSLSRDQVLRDFKSMSQPNGLLVIEANQLRSESIKEFLNLSDQTDYLLYSAMRSKKSLGLTYIKPSNADWIINARPIEMSQVVINPLQTTKDFHRANIDVVLGKYRGLESSVSCHATGRQLRHWSAKVDKRAIVDRSGVMIDRLCKVERNVSLSSVVLNHNVYVARNTMLKNTIVMPNAVISSNQNIRNSIIHGDTVYQIYG